MDPPSTRPRSMTSVDPAELREGREAFEQRAWKRAHEALSSAHRAGQLEPSDLWRLALASYLIGREDEFIRVLEEAHRAHATAGELRDAARCAFWLGFHLATCGEMAQATGWFGRAGRLIGDEDCAERGYILLTTAHHQLQTGELEAAARAAAEVAEFGRRFDEPDLVALGLHLQGRALLRQTKIDEGLALLDEAMITVSTEDLLPLVVGLIYCSVIGACREIWALGRAREWTDVLSVWCEHQPDMVAYGGECRVYRSELLQMRGEWPDAMAEARRANQLAAGRAGAGVTAIALYQQGEVHRLRGESTEAEEAYHAASRSGRAPQPGLALLRLAQGDRDAAAAAIRRALAETPSQFRRARLLPAHIEIMLEIGELDEAREAGEELAEIADACASPALAIVVAQARGAIALAAGDARAAIVQLREACEGWQALEAQYDTARVRALLGSACRALGDEEGAGLELSAARAVFKELGAKWDLARVEQLIERGTTRSPHGLTPREREVLALVATGRTNRGIAKRLFISEKTVARHVANIFRKLDVSSRTAAAAFAYEHKLLDPPT